jgi:hypothetical protein
MLAETYTPRPSAAYPNGFVRHHHRGLFTAPIALRHLLPGGIRTSRGICLDLGEGGMGVLVKGQLSMGATVEIDFQLQENTMTVIGIIRHTSSVRCGVEFVGLTAEERLQIAGIVGHG